MHKNEVIASGQYLITNEDIKTTCGLLIVRKDCLVKVDSPMIDEDNEILIYCNRKRENAGHSIYRCIDKFRTAEPFEIDEKLPAYESH